MATVEAGDIQLVTFKLDDQEYAVNIQHIVQVVRMVAITPALKAPVVVRGMINLRGKVIPVIDIRKAFALPPRAYDLNTQLLIIRTEGRMMALIVDVVSEVLTMPVDNLESPGEIAPHMTEYLWAVGRLDGRLILIVDPATILPSEQRQHLDDVLNDMRSLQKRLEGVLAEGIALPDGQSSEAALSLERVSV